MKIFENAVLEIEDLFLLEAFQIAYLPGYAPERELAAVLHAHPSIDRFLRKKCPSIGAYADRIKCEYGPVAASDDLERCERTLVNGITDLLCYNTCPELYDGADFHAWDFREVTLIVPLDGKVVVDGGAGTGRVALEAACSAKHVFAIEPVARLRQFIRDKARERGLHNVFVSDGVLDAIPLPGDFADIVITSHALGWRLEDELRELLRVVKPGGYIIHCPGTAECPRDDDMHATLTSPRWGYEFARYREADGWKRKYWRVAVGEEREDVAR